MIQRVGLHRTIHPNVVGITPCLRQPIEAPIQSVRFASQSEPQQVFEKLPKWLKENRVAFHAVLLSAGDVARDLIQSKQFTTLPFSKKLAAIGRLLKESAKTKTFKEFLQTTPLFSPTIFPNLVEGIPNDLTQMVIVLASTPEEKARIEEVIPQFKRSFRPAKGVLIKAVVQPHFLK